MSTRALSLTLTVLLLVPAAILATPAASAAPTVTHYSIISFDGSLLAATAFVPSGASASNRVPYVIMTHGWAGTRTATLTGQVAALVNAGYGVVTWDSRGFGESEGTVMLDSPDFEVRDAKRVIDFVVQTQPVLFESGKDPVLGMSGVSYAGGIQLLTAAFDSRVDVITPEITWNDLAEALGPGGVPKFSWIDLLFGAGQAYTCQGLAGGNHGCQTELLAKWYAEVMATNAVSPELRAELLYRSPATYMDRIQVPTLLIQGFNDTLFDVNQAVANYNGIKANGQPVKLWLYDGGHILPHETAGTNTQAGLIDGVVINWFDCHLKLVAGCDSGAEVQYYSGDGAWRSASSWPVPQTARQKSGYDSLSLVGEGGKDGFGMIDLQTVTVPSVSTGSAHVDFRVFSTGPTIFFAALGVRDGTQGKVTRIAQQNMPIRIDSTVLTNEVSVDLVAVSPALAPGQTLVLMLQSFDSDYNNQRTPGVVIVSQADVTWTMDAI